MEAFRCALVARHKKDGQGAWPCPSMGAARWRGGIGFVEIYSPVPLAEAELVPCTFGTLT